MTKYMITARPYPGNNMSTYLTDRKTASEARHATRKLLSDPRIRLVEVDF